MIRNLAQRIQHINIEMASIDNALAGLIEQTAPSLFALYGVGVDTAASLLVAAGDNPDRLHTERSWAHLCGVTPIPAGCGSTEAATGKQTLRSTASCSPAWHPTTRPATTCDGGEPKA